MAYKRNGYWYRSRREGRRVVTDYLGNGLLAELLAEDAAMEAAQRKLEREAQAAEREREREIDRAIDQAGDELRLLVRACLLANGYHNHKGQWRRRRDDRNEGDRDNPKG